MKPVLAVLVLLVLPLVAGAAGRPTDAEVDAVAAQLRCVVCQNLSVADSPSEMARQMRDLVRQRLAQGESPEAVKAYFVSRYGEWVLLTPPAHGVTLLVWVLPLAILAGGLATAVVVLRGWSRRGAAAPVPDDAPGDEALAAVRRELARRSR